MRWGNVGGRRQRDKAHDSGNGTTSLWAARTSRGDITAVARRGSFRHRLRAAATNAATAATALPRPVATHATAATALDRPNIPALTAAETAVVAARAPAGSSTRRSHS